MNREPRPVVSLLSPEAMGIAEKWLQQEQRYGLIFLDAEGLVVGLTAAAQTLLGYEPEELMGKSIATIFTRGDQALHLPLHEIEVALKVGFSDDDRWHRRKDGSLVWVGGALTRLKDGDGRHCGFVKIMRDQTDLRTQIEALSTRAARREIAQHQQADLVRTLAHELANSLGVVSNVTYLLPKVSSEARAKLFDSLASQTRALAQLLEDLRNSAPPPAHTLDARPLRLQTVLQEVVEACGPLVQSRDLELQLLVPRGDIELVADAAKLHQIVFNLTSNAIRYTPSGGKVWLIGSIEGPLVVIRVEDNGAGLDSEKLARLSDLLINDPPREHVYEEGTGLGLRVAHELVVLHGGTLEARSKGVGKGSAFSVRLPLSPTEPRNLSGLQDL
jgi:PAS domain S-box-containing protein